jgi:hypothetical protein
MEDKRYWIQVGPCHFHHTKRDLPTSPHKQHTPSSTRCQVSRVALRQETYLAQTHIHKTEATGNDAHQNALATWTEVKPFHSQQIFIFKAILKPICSYGIQLRETASTSNIEILERFQSKVLCRIVDAPWYVPNTVIWTDFQAPTVKEEIRHYSSQYSARLSVSPNDPVVNLMAQPDNRRLRRHMPNDLPTSGIVLFVVLSLRFSL